MNVHFVKRLDLYSIWIYWVSHRVHICHRIQMNVERTKKASIPCRNNYTLYPYFNVAFRIFPFAIRFLFYLFRFLSFGLSSTSVCQHFPGFSSERRNVNKTLTENSSIYQFVREVHICVCHTLYGECTLLKWFEEKRLGSFVVLPLNKVAHKRELYLIKKREYSCRATTIATMDWNVMINVTCSSLIITEHVCITFKLTFM